MMRRALAWTLALMLNVNHSAAVEAGSGSEADYRRAMDRLDSYIALVRELRGHIDRSQFELDARLDALDYDEQQILEFVSEQIHYELYPGLLRGAEGTLRSRAGNSLDQAVLLARLLEDAGFDARIARGLLSEGQARTLLSRLTVDPAPARRAGDLDAMKKAVTRYCNEIGLDCAEANRLFDAEADAALSPELRDLRTRQADMAAELIAALERKGIALGADANDSTLLQEARDYHWVEFRLSAAAPWSAAHPAFGDTKPLDFAPEATAVYADEVPAALQHRVRFEVTMRQSIGGREETHTLVPAWERPAANLAARPMTFQIASKNLLGTMGNPNRSFDPGMIHADLFVPSFSGSSAATAFDFAGNAVPMDAATSAFAGVFQTASDRLNKAAGALEGLGGTDAGQRTRVARLEAVVAYYTTISPNGEERRYQRTIYDARSSTSGAGGPAGIDDETAYRELTRLFTFQVGTGSPSPAQVLDATLEAVLQRRPLLELIVAYLHIDEVALESFVDREGIGEQLHWTGLSPLLQTFDAQSDRGDGQPKVYRDRPNILVHHKTMPIGGTIREAIDIVDNGRRALINRNDAISTAPQALLRTGVWETATEGSLLQPSSTPSINAVDVFLSAAARSGDVRVVTAAEETGLSELSVSDDSRAAIERDLARGYAVVLPDADSLRGASTLAWWRVDTSTGETLGQGYNGEGADSVDYTVLLANTLKALVVTVPIYLLCRGVSNAERLNRGQPVRSSDEIGCRNAALVMTSLVLNPWLGALGIGSLLYTDITRDRM